MKRASLSLDLDNAWAYLRTHGDGGWQSFPSYLDTVVPRALDFLRARNLSITFFIVGKDAALAKNHEALARIAAAGHEIGNHSFMHEPWLHLYDRAHLDAEIAMAEEAIARVTGVTPQGFRGPGFSLTPAVIAALVRRGYAYDASSLPTFIGPLARAYYLRSSGVSGEERRRRSHLFGSWSDGLAPNRPHVAGSAEGSLIEVPVTTFPGVRTPIHFSYAIYLASYSIPLARGYFSAALEACRMANVTPSLLLHPLDFMGVEDRSDLRFFPGMSLPRTRKAEILGGLFDLFTARYAIEPIGTHVARASGRTTNAMAAAMTG